MNSITTSTDATSAQKERDLIDESTSHSITRPIPAQEKLACEIDQITKKIEAHAAGLSSGITQNRDEASRAARHLKKEREEALTRKLLLQTEAARKNRSRLEKKKVEEVIERRPEIARPIYPQNDYLLNAIQEIAELGCGAEDRRRNEIIRSVRTLDDPTEEQRNRDSL